MPVSFKTDWTLTWTRTNQPALKNTAGGKQVYKSGSAAVSAIASGLSTMAPAAMAASEAIVREYTEQHNIDAKALAPIDTGELASKFDTSYEKTSTSITGRSFNTARYAAFVEFGFHHWRNGKFVRPMNPFMFPAFARRKQSFINAIRGIFG